MHNKAEENATGRLWLSGRSAAVQLARHTQDALLRKVQTVAILVLSDIYPPLPREIKSHSQKKKGGKKKIKNKSLAKDVGKQRGQARNNSQAFHASLKMKGARNYIKVLSKKFQMKLSDGSTIA